MSARIRLLLIAGLLGAGTISWAATEPGPDGESAPATDAKPAKPGLAKGMTGAQITKLIGSPEEVKPVKAKDIKAEEWIYRRKVGERSVEVATGQREVPAYTGVGVGNDAIQTRTEIIYTKKRVSVYQVTSLLLIDGRLAVAKQKLEQGDTYE